MGAQLPARWAGGSERRVECQIVPWIDWKVLWPVSCSALLGGANSNSKCNNPCKKKGDLEYFTILNTAK